MSLAALVAALPSMGFALSVIFAIFVQNQPKATQPFYTVVGCHSLGIYTVILLALLSFSVKMTVSPSWASIDRHG